MYPDPKPQLSDYPNVTEEEWHRIQARWNNSTPWRKAKRTVYAQQHREDHRRYTQEWSKGPKCKLGQRRYYFRVKAARSSLLNQISVDGHCAYKDPHTGEFTCRFPAEECDVDHLDPNTILADGRRRKQIHFGIIKGMVEFQREVARNRAQDGTLLLQALCPNHHVLKFKPCKIPNIGRRQLLQTVTDIKIQIRRCQFETCSTPEFVCDSADVARAFHFDHLFSLREDAPDHMRKKACVNSMIRAERPLDEIEAEIRKCRLLHANCHRRASAMQIARSRVRINSKRS